MKHLFFSLFLTFALGAIAAESFQLANGANTISRSGEILAVEFNTVEASQVVTASVVTAVTEWTNTYTTVTAPHTRYEFTITNFDGQASIATNVLDNFKYSDWIILGTNHIVGAVTPVKTNISERIVLGRLPKATYTHETAIGNGTASSHYLKLTPASTTYFMGGTINVSCSTNDNVRILIK